jgi:hypothetical protein
MGFTIYPMMRIELNLKTWEACYRKGKRPHQLPGTKASWPKKPRGFFISLCPLRDRGQNAHKSHYMAKQANGGMSFELSRLCSEQTDRYLRTETKSLTPWDMADLGYCGFPVGMETTLPKHT